MYLEKELLLFSEIKNLDIDIDYVLFGVYNTAINALDLLNSDFILYDRHKRFVKKFAEYLPEFYSFFYSIMSDFCKISGMSTKENVINYLLFTLINYWDGLISDYIQNNLNVSIIILSDKHC